MRNTRWPVTQNWCRTRAWVLRWPGDSQCRSDSYRQIRWHLQHTCIGGCTRVVNGDTRLASHGELCMQFLQNPRRQAKQGQKSRMFSWFLSQEITYQQLCYYETDFLWKVLVTSIITGQIFMNCCLLLCIDWLSQ